MTSEEREQLLDELGWVFAQAAVDHLLDDTTNKNAAECGQQQRRRREHQRGQHNSDHASGAS